MRSALTPADHAKAYRERRKKAGLKNHSGRSGKKDKWSKGEFIAIDGEGESNGKIEKFKVGDDGKTYHAADHIYTLLAASTGESLYNGGKRLSSQACIDFLCDLGASYKKGIFVIFAGSYDINHMLMFGFDRETLQAIGRGATIEYEHNAIKYSIEYRSRKSLTLKRNLIWKFTDNGVKPVWEDKITIWDTFGFFQESFVSVMKKWLGTEHKHYALIEDMKQRRGDFANVEQSIINAYNAAELETLVEIMNKVRASIDGLGLKCMRWDGAGAIAGALFRKHETREHKYITPEEVITAVRTAYAGGRIEVCKIGNYSGTVYDYDVNSAYPSSMINCPCMAHGNWTYGKNSNPPKGFTLIHCKYSFQKDLPFYPLFFRTDKMQIYFPSDGAGWYWFPEFAAAQLCPGNIEVIDWYHWQQTCDCKPFNWIAEYYKTRQQWVKNPSEDWQKGGEKIIKLGLNSLYGKTAQQLGGTKDKPPAYHLMDWAGYITADTRSKLFRAAMTDPESIIGFATDGIFTTRPLKIHTTETKELGAWELKSPVPQGLTIAMAGVYWWHYGDKNYSHFSRGFDKESMRTPEHIINAWQKGDSEIDIAMHRLITIGSACASDTLWKMRGRFTQGYRTLRLDGKSNKRQPCDVKKAKPHLKLIDLKPSVNIEYGYGTQDISYPYPVSWLDGDLTEDFQNELELEREMLDSENV